MKIKNIFILVSFGLLLTNCSIEDVEPNNLLTDDNVVRDAASANFLLNSAYVLFRSSDGGSGAPIAVNQELIFGLNLASDQFAEQFSLGFAENFSVNNVLADNITLDAFYVNRYKLINTVNFLIESLEKGQASDLSEAATNEMIAEARTLRAMAHFDLLRVFGQFYDIASPLGVVVRTEPARDGSLLPRNTVQETYDAIINDLQFGSDNGPSNLPHFRASAVTAQAYLAKAQLYAGDYTNAALSANSVLNNTGGYVLEGVYDNIFFNRWESSEVLFAPFGGNDIDEGTVNLFTSIIYSPFVVSPSPSFFVLADEQDGVSGDADSFTFSSGLDPRVSFGYNFTNPANENAETPFGFPGMVKYPFSAPFGPNGNTTYFLRLAEVYLIFAEAEARRDSGDLNEALRRLNELRTRATGIPLKTLSDRATLLEDIRNEKRLELFTENGESWFDLIRYHRLGDIDAIALKETLNTVNQFIFPIPQRALASNNLLQPNP